MKSRVTKNDIAIIMTVSILLAIAAVIAWRLFGIRAILPLTVVCLAIALWAQFESMRRTSEQLTQMRKDAFADFRQVESLLSLFATLKPEVPLPPFRDHSASPDFLSHAVQVILSRRPRIVVELGSGSSTVVLAQCLKKNGNGKLLSIDHDADFAERARVMLEERGLSDYATVQCKTLEPLRLAGKEYNWYSLGGFDAGGPIDFLVIDGPPYHVHSLARYPALPILLPLMAEDSVAMLDDADRPEELRIIGLWKKEFPELSMRNLEAEKGALLIERSAGSPDGFAREIGEDESTAHSRARIELG